jgi:orotate phosphoribosyltransferase
LLALLARIGFQVGQFKLSSRDTSDYNIDRRTTTLHAEGARFTGTRFWSCSKHWH